MAIISEAQLLSEMSHCWPPDLAAYCRTAPSLCLNHGNALFPFTGKCHTTFWAEECNTQRKRVHHSRVSGTSNSAVAEQQHIDRGQASVSPVTIFL